MNCWRSCLLRLASSRLKSVKKSYFPCHPARYSTVANNKVFQYLQSQIKAGGPITVADYMRIVLTNPDSGYYMHKDVFGVKGDFVTSPEISQMFGEMIGIWCVNEWTNLFAGQKLQVVELGPGRGTLAEDMLRVFSQFPDIADRVSLHLVEISPTLSQLQCERLTGKSGPGKPVVLGEPVPDGVVGPYREETSKYGQKISWYTALDDVPKGLSFYLAHEFLDALPIHKFQKTEQGWSEVLVDISNDLPGDKPSLRFVLSPGRTTASAAFFEMQVEAEDDRDHIEVCPAAGKTVQEVGRRIKGHGGFALFADYGHYGEKGDTFRAFKRHELHDPLVDPGSADLTADVDFSYLKKCVDGVSTFGPITQQEFLINMGIGVRLQMLLQKGGEAHWKNLLSGYDMLTNPAKMGERFKFLALMSPQSAKYVPAGFVMPDFLQKQ